MLFSLSSFATDNVSAVTFTIVEASQPCQFLPIVLTFSENIDPVTGLNKNNYSLKVNGVYSVIGKPFFEDLGAPHNRVLFYPTVNLNIGAVQVTVTNVKNESQTQTINMVKAVSICDGTQVVDMSYVPEAMKQILYKKPTTSHNPTRNTEDIITTDAMRSMSDKLKRDKTKPKNTLSLTSR